jgi:hypothetical protein
VDALRGTVLLDDLWVIDRNELRLRFEVLRIPAFPHELCHQVVGLDNRYLGSIDERTLDLAPLGDVALSRIVRQRPNVEPVPLLGSLRQLPFGFPPTPCRFDAAVVLGPESLTQGAPLPPSLGKPEPDCRNDRDRGDDDENPDSRVHGEAPYSTAHTHPFAESQETTERARDVQQRVRFDRKSLSTGAERLDPDDQGRSE